MIRASVFSVLMEELMIIHCLNGSGTIFFQDGYTACDALLVKHSKYRGESFIIQELDSWEL